MTNHGARKILVVDLDQNELACRILEAWIGRVRPAGQSASEAIAALPENDRSVLLNSAMAAMTYFRDQMGKGSVHREH